MPAGRVCKTSTPAHYEPHLYVDAVSGIDGKVRHQQPVIDAGCYHGVTHRVDAVDVAIWSSVTRFSPL